MLTANVRGNKISTFFIKPEEDCLGIVFEGQFVQKIQDLKFYLSFISFDMKCILEYTF